MAATRTIEAIPRKEAPASSQSRGLLPTATDERLVKRVRAGNEEAFAQLYERHHRKLLSYCRHMLGSLPEAEDALQQTFANAYRDIIGGEKELRVRPWLYRIAHNQCISMLRVRRAEVELPDDAPSVVGLSEEVARRDDLRELLGDLASLPRDQREALLLAELHDNSHAEVAEILGCERDKVKSLVFQARASLLKSREARSISCLEVQRQLSVLHGGSLRRSVLRRHLNGCTLCRHYQEEVKRQRAALALILPVVPAAGLKLGAASALAAGKAAAASLAGGSGAASGIAAGAAASAAGGSATVGASGSLTALAAKLGVSGAVLKGTAAAIAITAVAGGAAGVEVARHDAGKGRAAGSAVQHRASGPGNAAKAAGPGGPRTVPGEAARRSLSSRQVRRLAHRQLRELAAALGAPSLGRHGRGGSRAQRLAPQGLPAGARKPGGRRPLGQQPKRGIAQRKQAAQTPLRTRPSAPLGQREVRARRPSPERRRTTAAPNRRRPATRPRHGLPVRPVEPPRERLGASSPG